MPYRRLTRSTRMLALLSRHYCYISAVRVRSFYVGQKKCTQCLKGGRCLSFRRSLHFGGVFERSDEPCLDTGWFTLGPMICLPCRSVPNVTGRIQSLDISPWNAALLKFTSYDLPIYHMYDGDLLTGQLYTDQRVWSGFFVF